MIWTWLCVGLSHGKTGCGPHSGQATEPSSVDILKECSTPFPWKPIPRTRALSDSFATLLLLDEDPWLPESQEQVVPDLQRVYSAVVPPSSPFY